MDKRPTVLLIEDFDDAREMYSEYLEFSGLTPRGAADAVRGLRLADELQPSVILMDAALPGLSGWDAIQQLKDNPRTAHIPVLMLTGHVLGDARERALAAGANRFHSQTLPAGRTGASDSLTLKKIPPVEPDA